MNHVLHTSHLCILKTEGKALAPASSRIRSMCNIQYKMSGATGKALYLTWFGKNSFLYNNMLNLGHTEWYLFVFILLNIVQYICIARLAIFWRIKCIKFLPASSHKVTWIRWSRLFRIRSFCSFWMLVIRQENSIICIKRRALRGSCHVAVWTRVSTCNGHAIAQAVSHRSLTVEVCVHTSISPCGICVDKVALGHVFVWVLCFSHVSIIPPWPVGGRSSETVSPPSTWTVNEWMKTWWILIYLLS
jgi:hypothetical protein